jgi:hypothetical protein
MKYTTRRLNDFSVHPARRLGEERGGELALHPAQPRNLSQSIIHIESRFSKVCMLSFDDLTNLVAEAAEGVPADGVARREPRRELGVVADDLRSRFGPQRYLAPQEYIP